MWWSTKYVDLLRSRSSPKMDVPRHLHIRESHLSVNRTASVAGLLFLEIAGYLPLHSSLKWPSAWKQLCLFKTGKKTPHIDFLSLPLWKNHRHLMSESAKHRFDYQRVLIPLRRTGTCCEITRNDRRNRTTVAHTTPCPSELWEGCKTFACFRDNLSILPQIQNPRGYRCRFCQP